MGRLDRRQHLALDESYRYYRSLNSGEKPDLFKISRTLNTLTIALSFAEHGEFKLTRQIWKRLEQALFDAYLTNFPGRFSVFNSADRSVEPPSAWPDDGWLSFRPDGCRRREDTIRIEIHRLFPRSFIALQKCWSEGRLKVSPADFAAVKDCEGGVCLMRPMVVGYDLLGQESDAGRREAYHRWWDLYWQAYCTTSRAERAALYKHMLELETVWGEMYY
jgi:hypothetical protein